MPSQIELEIASLRVDVEAFKTQLIETNLKLQENPESVVHQTLKGDLETAIVELEAAIADIRASAPEPEPAPVPAPVEEKWSKEKHPAFQAGYKRPGNVPEPTVEETQAPAVYKVNDMVLAKWVSGDKAFYPARITSITGSSASPVYSVTFKSYGNSETLRGGDIKPILTDSKKRKADGSPAMATSPIVVPQNPNIISAAANINADLAQQARQEPSKATDGAPKPAKIPRKVKANKELEAGKSKWQDFNTKGKMGKLVKKDSMFRTGEGVGARVGFTGSGQAMRKDPTRTRHVYQATDEEGV